MDIRAIRVKPADTKNPLPRFEFLLREGLQQKREVIAAANAEEAFTKLADKSPAYEHLRPTPKV